MQAAGHGTATTRTVGIGLIGTGFMGGVHARAYRNAPWIFPDAAAQPDLRIVADARLDDARAFAARFGIPQWTDDWRTLLGRADLDVIDVCTPPALHRRMATEVAGAGKHVYCEKPVGRDLGETTAIWEAVQNAGVLSFVGLNYRFAPAVMLANELIREGRLGELRQIRVSMRTAYSAGGQNIGGWRYSREQAGAGTLGDHGSHVFDLATHLAGPIVRLCGTTVVSVPERDDPETKGATFTVDNDDTFAALVEFASGATGIIDASRVATGSRGELTFDIVGSTGSVRWDLRRMNELQLFSADAPPTEEGWKTVQTGPANWPYGQFIPSSLGLGYVDTKVIEVYRIVEAVAKREPISPNVGDMLHVARLIDAVQQGGWIDVAR